MRVGDMVRVVGEVDGRQEFLYGRIGHFVKADGRRYRRQVAKPYGAYVDLIETYSPARRPLSEITPIADDFEFIRDYDEVHKGAFGPAGMLWCMGCPRPYPMPAQVKVVHKATGVKTQLCEAHNDEEQWAQLGHKPMHDARMGRDTIESLTRDPQQITGQDRDAHQLREWADLFPHLVPEKAAELHAQWKEQQNASVAA